MKLTGTFLVWTLFWIDVFFLWVLYHLDFYTTILILDTTFISHSILAIYFVSNILIFHKAWTKSFRIHEYISNVLWWTSTSLLAAGMFGTVLGFFVLSFGLFPGDIDLTNNDTIKQILAQLTDGLSVALITTMVGFVTSHLLSLKLTLLQFIDDNWRDS